MADKKIKTEWLTTTQAALRFGVADRTFRRWIERGLPIEAKSERHRQINWLAALAWYVQDQIQTGPVVPNTPATPQDETINEAFLRKTRADADLKEHELGVRRQNYVQVALVQKTIADLATRIRAKLLAIPGKLSPELEGMTKAEMQERLEIEMIHILSELQRVPEGTQ